MPEIFRIFNFGMDRRPKTLLEGNIIIRMPASHVVVNLLFVHNGGLECAYGSLHSASHPYVTISQRKLLDKYWFRQSTNVQYIVQCGSRRRLYSPNTIHIIVEVNKTSPSAHTNHPPEHTHTAARNWFFLAICMASIIHNKFMKYACWFGEWGQSLLRMDLMEIDDKCLPWTWYAYSMISFPVCVRD